jgi:hypothetical protein
MESESFSLVKPSLADTTTSTTATSSECAKGYYRKIENRCCKRLLTLFYSSKEREEQFLFIKEYFPHK